MSKSFETLPVPCLKCPLGKKLLVPRGIRPWRKTFGFEYLHEFETEFENNLGYESGLHIWGQFMKNPRGKISRATVPVRHIGFDLFLPEFNLPEVFRHLILLGSHRDQISPPKTQLFGIICRFSESLVPQTSVLNK
jgi:hypothetical protein